MTGRHASLLGDLDALLASDTNFLMGHWVADARAWGAGNASWADDLEEEARNQVTVWGVVGSDVSDYAAKNGWSGLVARYYGSRWDLHTQYVLAAAASGQPVNWTAYGNDLAALEAGWLQDRTPFPTTPSGNALAAASAALAAYATGDASNYDALPNTDAPAEPGSQPVDIYHSVHTDVGVLMALCDAGEPRACMSTLAPLRCCVTSCFCLCHVTAVALPLHVFHHCRRPVRWLQQQRVHEEQHGHEGGQQRHHAVR